MILLSFLALREFEMILLDYLLLALLWLGHFSLCVALFNRLHAVRISRKLRRVLELLLLLSFPLAVVYYSWHACTTQESFLAAIQQPQAAGLFLVFPAICWLAILVAIPYWLLPRWQICTPNALQGNHTVAVNVVDKIGPIETHGPLTRFLSRLPGNEIFHLQLQEKLFQLPSLPTPLNNFSIIHLSDLHFTGDIGQNYFDYVIDAANDLAGDVVILSGDIIESVACEPWLTQTLGRLQAKQGKYFILGNHDLRMPNVPRVRETLCSLGFIDLGGAVHLTEWNGSRVMLVGDERPWFPGPHEAEIARHAATPNEELLRVLVAHTPDRFPWARKHHFALMLAGHNHGGQVRFPFIGPLISPSLSGTRYAGGVYYESPTLLHVSRGVSGEHPVRWNCPPEVTKLVLRK